MNQFEIIGIAKRLIELNSENPPGLEKEAAEFVAQLLSEIGMEVIMDEVAPGRPNVIGQIDGEKSDPTLVLNGYLDVVPGDHVQWDALQFEPRLREGRLYGRGACDMKGGVSSIIGAVKAIVQSGIKLQGNLLLTAA